MSTFIVNRIVGPFNVRDIEAFHEHFIEIIFKSAPLSISCSLTSMWNGALSNDCNTSCVSRLCIRRCWRSWNRNLIWGTLRTCESESDSRPRMTFMVYFGEAFSEIIANVMTNISARQWPFVLWHHYAENNGSSYISCEGMTFSHIARFSIINKNEMMSAIWCTRLANFHSWGELDEFHVYDCKSRRRHFRGSLHFQVSGESILLEAIFRSV